jgi:hypothetical protein
VPLLEYKIEGKTISYKWTNVVGNFNMPIKVSLDTITKIEQWITPSDDWKTITATNDYDGVSFLINKNFYVKNKNVGITGELRK